MARGRMISQDITKDKKINNLSDDTSRLAFTWLIPFGDAEGRTFGDPAIVRSMLFPRRTDITIERMTEMIQEWHDAGLIVWYEANGDQYIYFPNFEKHQSIRKDREAPSRLPPPLINKSADFLQQLAEDTPDLLRSNDGVTRVKLKEVKLKEVEVNRNGNGKIIDAPTATTIFCKVTGLPSIPGKDIDYVIEKICDMALIHSDIKEYLQPFYDSWIKKKRKDGNTYYRGNPGWLDWAITGEIPPDTKQVNPLEGFTSG